MDGKMTKRILIVALSLSFAFSVASAQDVLPADAGLATYHSSPRYRESESHPLRILAYVLHPIGWAVQEVITRPLSYFASSSETRRSIMGYREPYDYRQPECFSADDSIPDCRSIKPFNYDMPHDTVQEAEGAVQSKAQIYFPDVNFDFNKHTLNDLGRGQTRRVAKILKENQSGVNIVLQGNADYIGNDAYNEKLGLDRAETVKNELVSLGLSVEKLSTVTFGKTKPILPEQEDWARAVNRRVEVHTDGQ